MVYYRSIEQVVLKAGSAYYQLLPPFFYKVCRCILDSGQKLAKKENSKSPLLFEWHDKKYIGAAHGMAGILALLMQVN